MSKQGRLPSEYLNVRDTARLLGVHENTIRNWVRAGTLRSSRVPGSSSHRFERAEVERLQRERGAAASSVAPLLRVESPDLVGPSDLDRWAGTHDAKGAFPELIARLLVATPTIANVEMRSHEGVAAPGWDGSANSAGSTVLPAGNLRFELGTNAKIKTKADDDYAKRVQGLEGRHSSNVFVFVTPRNWPGGEGWAAAKRSEGHFREVRVLDAHTLTLWLQSTPSVHYWISERLGRSPRDARTIDAWRSHALGTLRVVLPVGFFLAGRSAQAEVLRERISTQQPMVTTVQAGSRSEAIAFVHAVTSGTPQLADRIVVVENPAAWRRIADSSEPLVLIPNFADADTRTVADHGHAVVLGAGASERVPNPDIDLPKVDPHVAAEALRQANQDRNDDYRLVALARRSFPALVRSESSDARVREPDWTRDSAIASIVARLVLVGVWTEQADDRVLIGALVGASELEIETALAHLETREDAPFVRSGGIWRLTSPYEMGLLLFPRLGDADKARWIQAIEQVFLEPDPYAGMNTSARLAAQLKGTRRRYSEELKAGLAEQLALVAGLSSTPAPKLPTETWAQAAVARLLSRAAEGTKGRIWCDLSSVLPQIAEAAPDIFLTAVEQDLENSEPMLRRLFQDTESDFFGASSPHTGLLWAIECLCWNREFFGRATKALVGLATIDPGGRLSNRPFESLKNVTLGWIRHSGVRAAEKLSIIRHLLEGANPVGWRLLIAVWPGSRQAARTPYAPRYRDWTPGEKGITWGEWGEFVEGLTDLALKHVNDEPGRWVDLIDSAPSMPPKHRERIRVNLARQARESWTPAVHFAIWKQLVDEISRHEEFPDAEWSMSSSELREWRAVADGIGSAGDPRRHSSLFAWRPRLAGIRHDHPEYRAAVRTRQLGVIQEIAGYGAESLQAFTRSVEDVRSVGVAIAAHGDQRDREVLSWLGEEDEPLLQAAMEVAHTRARERGISWVMDALTWPELGTEKAQQRLVRAIPADSANWSQVSLLGEGLEAIYWQNLNAYAVRTADRQAAVQILLERNLPWAAITVLANELHDGKVLDGNVVKETLQRAAADPAPVLDRTMTSHHIEKLLEHLEDIAFEDRAVAALEFTYFRFLHDHRPSNSLYRALSSDPHAFVELVSAVFRAEGEPARDQSADDMARATIAYEVLHHWPVVPGYAPEGGIDGRHLSKWVASARAALARHGRASIGDELIGGALSASPTDVDGIWPAKEVRDVIEGLKNARIDTGLHIGVRNRRNVTVRGVFDGGEQERGLEARYRSMAAEADAAWPRTARILRGLADAYQADAREFDARAQRLGDHG